MRKALLLAFLPLLGTPCAAQEQVQSIPARRCDAQHGCRVYYAYLPFAALDAQGNPVIDPATGKEIESDVCLLWKSYYTRLDNAEVEITGSNFYSKYSYRVDPRSMRVTVYALEAPRVIAITSGTGWFPIGGVIEFPANITVPLYPLPQSGWSCTEEDWAAALSAPDREYVPPPTPSPPGGFHIGPGPVPGPHPNINYCVGIRMASPYCAPLRR